MKHCILSTRARSGHHLAKILFLASILACALALPVHAAFRKWTSSFLSPFAWSVPENWDPVGVPQDGDDLFFGDAAIHGATHDMLNDLPNLRVRTMTFRANTSFESIDWSVTGNTLGILEDIAVGPNNGTEHVTISCGLRLEAAATFTMQFASDSRLYVRGPLDLNGHNLDLNLGAGTAVELTGVISGVGDISMHGYPGGTLGINGSEGNTFQGAVIVNSFLTTDSPVHLRLNKATGPAVPRQVILRDNTILTLDSSEQIADDATVDLIDGGTIDLNGFIESIGTLRLSNRVTPTTLDSSGLLRVLQSIVVANHGPLATIGNGLELGGFIPIYVGPDADGVLEINANISGNGFDKIGPGTLRLGGVNAFFGDVAATQGTIEALNYNAFSPAPDPTFGVHLNGGNVVLKGVPIAVEPLFVNSSVSVLTAIGQCSWNGPVTLNTTLKVVALDPTSSGATFDMIGSLSGPGGLDLLSPLFGAGNVRLRGGEANTFTGPLTADCQRLELAKPFGVKAYSGPLIVGRPGSSVPSEVRWLNSYQNVGATLTLFPNAVVNLNGFNEDFGPVTFNGGRVETGTGQFAIYQPLTVNPSSDGAIINGFLGLPPGVPAQFNVGDGAADPDLLVNAVVFGNAPGLIKLGAGTMSFAGANTYAGYTVVQEGILEAGQAAALGSASGATIVAPAATLRLGGVDGMAENFELNGAGLGGTHGALEMIGSGTLSGSVFLGSASTINVAQSASLVLNGVISGNGPLTKNGPGNLFFGGSSANTYSGDTMVSQGALGLRKPNNSMSVPGNLILGPAPASSPAVARLFQAGGLGANSRVTVNANSLFDLNGNGQTLAGLNLNDGGSARTGAGRLNFVGGAVVQVGSLSPSGSHASSSITGNLGLPPNDFISFNVAPYAVVFPFATGPELDVPAVVSVNGFENVIFARAGFSKDRLGRMRLGGNNTYKGDTFVDDGTLQVDGVQPQSAVGVNAGARLQGVGTVGPVFVSGNSTIAPGSSPGILTCSNFNSSAGSGRLQVELNGTAPGSGYDQLNVRGTVRLTGVTLNASLGFASAVGQQFMIINNDGADAVTGTFTGLPQNSSLYMGGEQFTISYTGGTGNDVVLTRLVTPPRPVLAIEKAPPSFVRLLWPTNAVGFTLQSNTNLNTTNWTAALPLPVITGTNNIVLDSMTNSQRFYRLFHP